MKVATLALAALLCFGCGDYDEVWDLTQVGSYTDPEFGSFHATLKFNSRDIQAEQSAEDIARIAAVAAHALREVGEKFDYPEYIPTEESLLRVRNIEARVLTEETYFEVGRCGADSIACNHLKAYGLGDIIYLLEGVSYNCRNRYAIGHELTHSMLHGINHPGNVNHAAPDVFAWDNSEEPREWNADSAEELIRTNPASECGYKDQDD